MNPQASDFLAQFQELQTSISGIYQLPVVQDAYLDHFQMVASKEKLPEDAPEDVKKVEKALIQLGIRDKCRFHKVEPDYYNWELSQRAIRLCAPSDAHVCKSVVFNNSRMENESVEDPLNSAYYSVLVQYVSSVNSQKLMNFVRGLKDKSISKKNYNFRVANEDVALKLAGFHKNGVCPFGMKTNIPVILSADILKLKPPVVFIGGGHVEWKMSIPIDVFIESTNCFIADLS